MPHASTTAPSFTSSTSRSPHPRPVRSSHGPFRRQPVRVVCLHVVSIHGASPDGSSARWAGPAGGIAVENSACAPLLPPRSSLLSVTAVSCIFPPPPLPPLSSCCSQSHRSIVRSSRAAGAIGRSSTRCITVTNNFLDPFVPPSPPPLPCPPSSVQRLSSTACAIRGKLLRVCFSLSASESRCLKLAVVSRRHHGVRHPSSFLPAETCPLSIHHRSRL